MTISIQLPLSDQLRDSLKAGDRVSISGVLYTARDAAHKRMTEALSEGNPLPFPLDGAFLYYMGPSPSKPGKVIGSAGPTTSYRMDAYTPQLLERGLVGMIGKGPRNPQVKDAIQKNQSIYFATVGGAGAFIAKSILQAKVIAYEDLGAEAIMELTVKDFPAFVAIDSHGHDFYEIAKNEAQNGSENK